MSRSINLEEAILFIKIIPYQSSRCLEIHTSVIKQYAVKLDYFFCVVSNNSEAFHLYTYTHKPQTHFKYQRVITRQMTRRRHSKLHQEAHRSK